MKSGKYHWEIIGQGLMLCHPTIHATVTNVTNVIWNTKPAWSVKISGKTVSTQATRKAALARAEALLDILIETSQPTNK